MWVALLLLPSFLPSSIGKQGQLLLQPTEVELGLQVGVEFDKSTHITYTVLRPTCMYVIWLPLLYSEGKRDKHFILAVAVVVVVVGLKCIGPQILAFHKDNFETKICFQI